MLAHLHYRVRRSLGGQDDESENKPRNILDHNGWGRAAYRFAVFFCAEYVADMPSIIGWARQCCYFFGHNTHKPFVFQDLGFSTTKAKQP